MYGDEYDRLLSPIALVLVLAIVGQMVHMLVDVFSSRPQVQSLWICAALVAAIGRIKEDEINDALRCAIRVSKNASMVLLGTVIRMAMTFAFVVYAARYFGV